jgi:hypothetical protein
VISFTPVGFKSGRLTIIGALSKLSSGKKRKYFECYCECGSICEVRSDGLYGHTNSCGCLQSETAFMQGKRRVRHGMKRSREYGIWNQMIQRCSNPNNQAFKDYGARGIAVCNRWRDFVNFFEDMGDCPVGKSLDRIDTNGNYDPSNCRWANSFVQANNKRSNVFIECNGKRMSIAEWSRETGLSEGLISARKRRGWADSKCLNTLVGGIK